MDLELFDDRKSYQLTHINAKLDHKNMNTTKQWVRENAIPRMPIGKGRYAFSGRILNEVIVLRSQRPGEQESEDELD